MNVKNFFLLIMLTFVITMGFSQRFIGSVIAGGNMSQVDGDEVFGFKKIGANVGASVTLPIDRKERFFFTIELLYNQKGSRMRSKVDTMDYTGHTPINESVPYDPTFKYKLNLDYVEVPVLFHFEDPYSRICFGVGASWGRLVYAREIESGYRLITDVRSGIYSKNDWCAIADVKIPLYKGLRLNIRYQYSFIKLRTRDFVTGAGTPNEQHNVRNQYNNVISVRLIYSFNEKFTENMRKDKDGKRRGPKWVRIPNEY